MVNSRKATFFVLCILFVLAFVSAFCVVAFSAKADSGFIMSEQGAELRLNQEYSGMRFTAKIYPSDYNAEYSYGMIITPNDYIDAYIDGENPDYIAQFESQGVKIINLTNMTPIAVDANSDSETDYYLLKGVISNILYNNFNREFFAIAYYNDGVSNHYATVSDTENVRSIAVITDSALNDAEFMESISDDPDQLAQIYSFKYKASYQSRGYNESEIPESSINTLADYYSDEQAQLYGTGVLADFDEEYYSSALVLPSTTESGLKENSRNQNLKTIITDDSTISAEDYVACDSGVLKLNYLAGGGTGVRFPYTVTVAADTVINFKVFSHDWTWFRVAKEGALGNGYSLNISTFDQWITKSVLATTLGYKVGDTLSELEIYVSSYWQGTENYPNGYFYIDEISYSTLSNLEAGLDDFEVANYDSTDYQTLSDTSFDVIENGGNTVLSGLVGAWTNYTYPLVKSTTVTATSQLVIRVKSEVNGALYTPVNKVFGILNNYTEISYSMVDDLGYTAGATVSTLTFRNQSGTRGYIYIDSIKIIDLASGLSGDVYADFNSSAYSYFVGSTGLVFDNSQSAAWKNYEWGARDDFATATIDTVSGQSALKISGSQYYGGRAVKLAKTYPTVTADTFIKLRVYSTASNLRVGKYKSTTSIGTDYSAKISATNQWINVTFYATEIGYAVGDSINGLNVFCTTNGGAYLAIDYIEIFDLTFDLTGNRVVDFSAPHSEYLVNAGTVTNGVYSYSGAYAPGATIKFAEDKTYAEGDFIAINISATKRAACCNPSITMSEQTMFYIIANDPNYSNWEYAPTSSGVYQTILLPVSKFGYSVDDTVNSIKITNWDSTTLYINWIDYVSYGDLLAGDYVAKYDADSVAYANALVGKSGLVYKSELATNSTWANYEFHSRATTFALEEVNGSYAVKFACANSYLGGSVKFLEHYANITADTMIELRVYSTVKNIRLATYKSTTSIGTDFSSQITANAWSTVVVKATDVGYSVGDTIKGINVFGTGGANKYIAISYACVYERYSTLADGTLANFNESDRYDSSFGLPGITSDPYKYWSNHAATTRTLLSEGYSGSDGGVFYFHGANYGGTSIKFIRSVVVTDTNYLELKVNSTKDVFNVSKYGSNSTGTAYNLPKTGCWTAVIVKLTDLGYSVGDIVNGIDLYVIGGEHDLYFDYVRSFDMAEGYLAADFNSNAYTLSTPSISYQFSNNYQWYSTLTTKSVNTDGYSDGDNSSTDGVLYSKNDNICGGYHVTLPSVKVTANLKIRVKVLTLSNANIRFYKSGVADAYGEPFATTAGTWTTIEFLATDRGYSVGDMLTGLNVYISGAYNTCYIDDITYIYAEAE